MRAARANGNCTSQHKVANKGQFERLTVLNLQAKVFNTSSKSRALKLAISEFSFASVSKRVQVRNLSYENEFYSQVHSNANHTHFHMKDFALGLGLKQRQKATRKWPIGPYWPIWPFLGRREPFPLPRATSISHEPEQSCILNMQLIMYIYP